MTKKHRPLPVKLFLIFICMFQLSSCKRNITHENEKIYVNAVEAYAEQQYEKSLDFTNEVLAHDKNFYQASLLKAKILFFTENSKESIHILKKLIKKYPSYTEARIWYIRCLILEEMYEDAKKEIETELSFNQSDWRVYYLYALLAKKNDDYVQNLAMNRQAELVLTDSAKVYLELAQTWHLLGLKERAAEYFQKAQVILDSNSSMQEIEKTMDQLLNSVE